LCGSQLAADEWIASPWGLSLWATATALLSGEEAETAGAGHGQQSLLVRRLAAVQARARRPETAGVVRKVRGKASYFISVWAATGTNAARAWSLTWLAVSIFALEYSTPAFEYLTIAAIIVMIMIIIIIIIVVVVVFIIIIIIIIMYH
jgi:hypothetical protein